jgi:hypothetical protein
MGFFLMNNGRPQSDTLSNWIEVQMRPGPRMVTANILPRLGAINVSMGLLKGSLTVTESFKTRKMIESNIQKQCNGRIFQHNFLQIT